MYTSVHHVSRLNERLPYSLQNLTYRFARAASLTHADAPWLTHHPAPDSSKEHSGIYTLKCARTRLELNETPTTA